MNDKEALEAVRDVSWGRYEETSYPTLMLFVHAHLAGHPDTDKIVEIVKLRGESDFSFERSDYELFERMRSELG